MDVVSYLLGKNASSGGGGGGTEEYFRNELVAGTSNNQSILKMIKTIPKGTIVNTTNLSYAFNKSSIEKLPWLDTKNVTSISYMCNECSNLTEVPLLDFSSVLNANSAFEYCVNLTTVPVFDLSSCVNMSSMYRQVTKLTDESLDNILQTCLNATSYSGKKSLDTIGITTYNYHPDRLQKLPHFEEFWNAGWRIY